MIANSQQRRRSTFETNILKFFFLERASTSNFCCATNQNNPHILKYVSYDRSRLLQPCGKLFSWAPPVPLGKFYPLAPPPPRNFHEPSMGGYGYFLEPHNLFNKLPATRLHERWKLVVSIVDVFLQVVSIQTLAAKLHKSGRKLASFLSYSTHLYIPRQHFI